MHQEETTLENKILKYKGTQPFILKTKRHLEDGNKLSLMQVSLADKLFKIKKREDKKDQKKESRKIQQEQKVLYRTVKIDEAGIRKYFNDLYSYQIDGIQWLIEPESSRWLLDEQGLGKTMQCIIASLILNTGKKHNHLSKFIKK